MSGFTISWRQQRRTPLRRSQMRSEAQYDLPLLIALAVLLGVGLVMVSSSSISVADRQLGEPFYYLLRQMVYVGVGASLAFAVVQTPLEVWERGGPLLLLVSLLLLLAVLVPGVGRTVNGSTRWLSLLVFNLQVSELAKLVLIVYTAGYLVRRGDEVRSTVGGFVKPLALLAVIAVLLLAEPDFGAVVVMSAIMMGMLFLAGVRLWLFGLLASASAGLLGVVAVASPYRLERLTSFLNPWANPFSSGFQLTQALIAFGRGDWFGVGLGASVQKLFYLPEAHTDFLFAVLAEELGLFGALGVIALFMFVIWRAFVIGRNAARCEQHFGAYIAYGVALWIGLQTVINLGVNMGLLPTKGLTLPLMSYGGSSMIATCIALGLVLRVDRETRLGGAA